MRVNPGLGLQAIRKHGVFKPIAVPRVARLFFEDFNARFFFIQIRLCHADRGPDGYRARASDRFSLAAPGNGLEAQSKGRGDDSIGKTSCFQILHGRHMEARNGRDQKCLR